MVIEKGTLIYANFTAKVKDTGEAIETTIEDEAKKLGIYDSGKKYEPRLIAVGEGWVIQGLDEEVMKMEVGEKKEIELPPQRAFGERDPSLVRMIPLRRFGDRANELAVGDIVEVDNKVGVVRYIGSGRAQVDFNHRLAGKTLVYTFEVVKKLENDEEKISALIKRRFGVEGEKVSFKINADELVVEIPEQLFLLEGLQIIKRGVSNDIFHFIKSLNKVTFIERYTLKVEKKEELK